jgi:drug/metabolite transporter (DMT)-like permease
MRLPTVGFICVALTVAFTVCGQLLVRYGMRGLGASPTQLGLLPHFLLRAFTHPAVVSGLACAVLAAACWTLALSRLEINQAYPFMGLAIVLVLALAPLLGEAVPLWRWVGVALVCLGLWVAVRQ